MNNQTNYTMLCDFYELSMANGYFQTPLKDCITYFDVFFRTIPDEGGFAITAGLEQVVNYIQNLTFRIPPFQRRLRGRIFGLPEELQVHR